MPDLEIIGTPYSNYVRSVRMLCAEKQVPYVLTPSRPHTPEVQAIHPAGLIPVMRHGAFTLFESKAIATYIDRAFPGPRLIPEDCMEAARVEQWVSFCNVKVDRWIMRECVVPLIFYDKAKGPDMARINAALPEVDACCRILDKAVAPTGYLAGDELTYADLNVLPMLTTAQLYPSLTDIITRYSALTSYVMRLTDRASFKSTAPPPRGKTP